MPLLVPIDLHEPSRQAVELAALIGEHLAREVLLLHVSERPPPLERLAELHALGEPIRRRGVQVRLRTTRGRPAERILEISEQRQVSWILIGTGGHAFRNGRGSIARQVMERAPAPVVTLRPGSRPPNPTRRIAIVASDPQSPSARIGHVLARSRGAELAPYTPSLADDAPTGLAPILSADAGYDAAVVPFDASCAIGTWCERLLTNEPKPVVLVSGEGCCWDRLVAK